MLTFTLITEEIATRREVGRGLGGYTGSILGGLAGSLAGGIGGMALSPNDNDAIGIGALGGSILGTTLGRGIGKNIGQRVISNPDDPANFSKVSHRIGYLDDPPKNILGLESNPKDLEKRLDKIGYSDGIAPYVFSPVTGFFKPNKLKENK